MLRRPPRSTLMRSSAASDVYKRQGINAEYGLFATENFHGRTLCAVSASTDPDCRTHFGPFVPNIDVVPYNDVSVLDAALSDKNVAAFIIEPIQGEAGVVLPSDGYLQAVRDACTRHNVLMVADEIQTGLGRTGYMRATEHENVRADVVLLGKALSGGLYPVSAVLADRCVMDVITPGTHGSTFGGSVLASRVALAALKALETDDMLANSVARGKQLRAGLRTLPSDVVREVRGRGLMNAIVIESNGDNGAASALCLHFAEHGLLAKPTHGDRIRFTPPLVISEQQVDECLARIARSVDDFRASRK
eukprot:TRINITY_DN417_c0_g2_i3.p1 TRINITY_DN417_c0_g2~~TRINITY_DN417_c0_g2_i3.p1  ORF type:complete len:306 (+),score=160.36 TRINITY_DN417_c0_g2_i3:243-1160(+)